MSGVVTYEKTTAEGGKTVGDIQNGEWIAFEPYQLGTASSFSARVSSGGAGGTLQIRAGSPTGNVLGSVAVPVTGSYETFTTVTGSITGAPAAAGTLYLTFAGGAGTLFDLDSFTFTTGGNPPTRTGPVRGLASKCLDVRNGSSADGTQVQLSTCNAAAAQQQWTVNADGTLRALGKCLDVNGGSSADGTKVQLWTCHGGGPQQWAAQSDGSVRNAASSKCLDVSGNSSADGTVVHLWSCNGGANQKWTLP
jgi:hypothetical protein